VITVVPLAIIALLTISFLDHVAHVRHHAA